MLLALVHILKASAFYQVEIDGLYYSGSDNTCSVVNKDGAPYKTWSHIKVPQTIEYYGTTYTVTSIGGSAFRDCTNLTSIELPNTITKLGATAFEGCTKLKTINLPSSVQSLGNLVFLGCTSLTNISLNDGLKVMGDAVFRDCTSLTSVDLNGVTTIPVQTFERCTNLTTINIPNSVTAIGNDAFRGCTNLRSINIPNSVTSIGSSAFNHCESLMAVSLPEGITMVAGSLFASCINLKEVHIPNSVKTIDACAFANCTCLQSITIPYGVISIDQAIVDGCTNLKDIYNYSKVPATIEDNSFNKPKSLTLHVLKGYRSVYASTPYWKSFGTIVDDIEEVLPPCATPTVTVTNGELLFDCATEGATFHYEYSVGSATQSAFGDGTSLSIPHLFPRALSIVVTATAAGHSPSVPYTFTVTFDDGDVNTDGKISIADVTALINKLGVAPNGEKDKHEYVDLGLPSGTLWATCNVGANSPEEYGDYFAWGEVEPKSTYNWSTYFDSVDGSSSNFKKYYNNGGKTELDLEDDAAYMNWGEGWRMPSRAQQDELRDTNNCTWTWTNINGKNGYLVKSKRNDSSLFLPAAGYRGGGSLGNAGSWGYSWSRSLSASYSDRAYYLYFNSSYVGWGDSYRCYGRSVRPVRVSSQN